MSNTSLVYSHYGIRQRLIDMIGQVPGRLYELLRLPGQVRSLDYTDLLTGHRIRVKIGQRFTIISVNNRDYWFKRISGKFDGTGSGFCSAVSDRGSASHSFGVQSADRIPSLNYNQNQEES